MMMMMMLMGMKCAVAFTLQFSKAIEERETILMEKKYERGSTMMTMVILQCRSNLILSLFHHRRPTASRKL